MTSNTALSPPPVLSGVPLTRGGTLLPAGHSVMNLLALTNGRGTDHVHITRLLGDTRVSEWQRALRKLLMTYIQHDVMKQAVTFLSDNIHSAIEAIRSPHLFPGFPCLYVHVDRKPVVFDIDLWKIILIAINFELTEPEGNRHLDLIEVKVTDKVTLPSLIGFHQLLKNILELNWDILRLILYLEEEEAFTFLCTLQDVLRSPSRTSNPTLVDALYQRQTSAMEELGFYQRRGEGRGSRRVVVWENTESEQVLYAEVVLFGLFHHGKGLETYI
ncbi:uncharacterized protein [Haliotis cracherodii]|uniref:uncharacterized protein isoform X1 n=1 Tax=Haliotis cracherodii TaxID=6455 RepID=UPI0039E9C3CA